MLYPSIDKLLNIVDSKYILVQAASKRSKQMLEERHYQMRAKDYKNKRELGRALEEIEKGYVKVYKDGIIPETEEIPEKSSEKIEETCEENTEDNSAN